jgi:hypothetical protein
MKTPRPWLSPLLIGSLFVFGSDAEAKPPTLNTLFPSGGSRGQTVEVAAGGSFDRWPVQCWVDGPGIEVRALEEKGKLTVVIAEDALPGVRWLRLHDEEGATALRPFLVGSLPEAVEAEPNDEKPQALEGSSLVVNGRLAKRGDVDGFSLALTKGQTLVASLEANRRLGSPMDGVLQVVSAEGFVLAQDDDDRGFDPQIVFEVPADGRYTVRAFAFPATPDSTIGFAGGDAFIYRLTLTTGGFVDHYFPLAISARSDAAPVEAFGWNLPDDARRPTVACESDSPTASVADLLPGTSAEVRVEPHPTLVEAEPNSVEQPQTLPIPSTLTGRSDQPRDRDVFVFSAKKSQPILFHAEARALGSPLDPVLRVIDAEGKTLTEVDDSGRRERDAELTFTAPADGDYRIVLRDLYGHGGFRSVYRLTASYPSPDYRLSLAAEQFTLTPGKPLTIPVTVDRRNGFDGAVELTVDGLPEGVTSGPVVSEPKGDSAKKVTLTLEASEGPVSGPIRIVGRVKGEPPSERVAGASLAGLDATTTRPWLTVLKKVEPPAEKAEEKKGDEEKP